MNAAGKMRARPAAVALALLIALCVAVSGCGPTASAGTFVPISGAGSTWAYPAIHSWIAGLGQQGMTVRYAPSGSRAGLGRFADGQLDWAASEIPYGAAREAGPVRPPRRGFTYMPDVAGGVALTYNLSVGGQRVTSLRLSGAVVAGIFTNQVTMWNDQKIAADNPGLTLPATRITPVVRSDGDGATAVFTQWMLATDRPAWQAYCAAVRRSQCTPTSAYPVQRGTAMVGKPGDDGVAAYVARPAADGAIGYAPYASALQQGMPVAKVLNAAGYYTAPTPGNVGVSLLSARLSTGQTANLAPVYTDTDPRAYQLSYYSYLVLPTDRSSRFTLDKGYTLGAFGQYLLCQGQQQVDALGYSALPINLVEAGFSQLQRVPGASVPRTTAARLAGCDNPTISPDGTDTLADSVPRPPACDRQGGTQCGSAPAGAVDTVTTLTASPDPAVAGQPVTLTATVTPATGAASPAGSVQFEVGGTGIGSPVAVGASGAAAVTTTIADAGTDQLAALFTPADATAFGASAGSLSLTVNPRPASAGIPLGTSVPVNGEFTLTVDTADTVTLAVTGNSATAAATPVVVSDTRNTYPGWSVSGQAADFTGSGTATGASIPGNQLGWAPTGMSLAASVTLGGVVAPAAPGLGTAAAVLASAPAGSGFGTSQLGADLTLAIPPEAEVGDYTGSLSVTAVTAQP
jgi:phosphate transport system substrate-binding protein